MCKMQLTRVLRYLGLLVNAGRDEGDTQGLLQILLPSHELGKRIVQHCLPPYPDIQEGDHHGVDPLEQSLRATFLVSHIILLVAEGVVGLHDSYKWIGAAHDDLIV